MKSKLCECGCGRPTITGLWFFDAKCKARIQRQLAKKDPELARLIMEERFNSECG